MTGTLNLYCLDCHEFVQWRKLSLYRQDGYPDWRIEAFCGCGSETDERVLAQARAAHDAEVDAEIETQQRNALDAVLTRSGNRYLETLSGMGPGRRRSDPCRSFSHSSDRSGGTGKLVCP